MKTLRLWGGIFFACGAAWTGHTESRSVLSLSAVGGAARAGSGFDGDYHGAGVLGVRFQRDLSPFWALGGQWVRYSFRSKTPGGEDLVLQPLTARVERRFPLQKIGAPYLHGDLGISRNEARRFSTQRTRTGFSWGFGAGLRWDWADAAVLGLEGGWRNISRASRQDATLFMPQAQLVLTFYLPETWGPPPAPPRKRGVPMEAPPAPTQEPVNDVLLAQGELNRVLNQIDAGSIPPILFEPGLPVLQTTSYEALDNIGAALRRYPSVKIRVFGFVEEDFVGGPLRADGLAHARSETVGTYLRDNFRLKEESIILGGLPPLPAVLEGETPPAPPRRMTFEAVP